MVGVGAGQGDVGRWKVGQHADECSLIVAVPAKAGRRGFQKDADSSPWVSLRRPWWYKMDRVVWKEV